MAVPDKLQAGLFRHDASQFLDACRSFLDRGVSRDNAPQLLDAHRIHNDAAPVRGRTGYDSAVADTHPQHHVVVDVIEQPAPGVITVSHGV